MVDRIERPDASSYRIHEADAAGDEGKGASPEEQRSPEEENKKEKDNFGRKNASPIAREIARPSGRQNPRIFSPRSADLSGVSSMNIDEEFSGSWTWRLKHAPLIALGVLDFDRRPRWGVIASYSLGLAGLIVSVTLILRFLYGV